MVDTDDTRRTIHDGRPTTPGVWHKLPTGELISGGSGQLNGTLCTTKMFDRVEPQCYMDLQCSSG